MTTYSRSPGGIFLGFVFIMLLLTPSSAFSSVIVEDDLGREVKLEEPVKRVVSLYAAHTENVVALGGRALLVGVSCSDSPGIVDDSIRRLPLRPGPEMLLALNPDLVLMRSMQIKVHPEFLSELERLGLPVVVLDPPGWEDLPHYLDRLGVALGRPEESRKLLVHVRETLARAAQRAALLRGEREKPSVFLVALGRKLYTCSPDSWAARLIEVAGGRNVAAGAEPVSQGSSIARFGIENLLALSESLDVMLVQMGKMNDLDAGAIAADSRLGGMRCVRDGRVVDIDEKTLSRPSLLRLEEALDTLIGLFYRTEEGR